MRRMPQAQAILLSLAVAIAGTRCAPDDARPPTPYEQQLAEQTGKLTHPSLEVRAGAAEALGYLRAYTVADALAIALDDPAREVRREASLSLSWCGARRHVEALLDTLDDGDWVVRQGAWVALTNLTGMEWPFDALAKPDERREQTDVWRAWWSENADEATPPSVRALVEGVRGADDLAQRCPVALSSAYKGSPEILTERAIDFDYWQTKNVPFPQHCTVDLGEGKTVACVMVDQCGEGLCMTDSRVSVSDDGERFVEVARQHSPTPPKLVLAFEPRPARYVRIASHASQDPVYPTSFWRIHVFEAPPPDDAAFLRCERGLRALGALGGSGTTTAIADIIEPYLHRDARTQAGRTMVQAGLRSLGRLADPEALPLLVAFLDNPQWARYAADALGDYAHRDNALASRATAALLAAYPRYARNTDYKDPQYLPVDDGSKGEFPLVHLDELPQQVAAWNGLARYATSAADRIYETPFAIASALARLPLDDADNLAALRDIAPLLVANVPADFDGAILYEPEAYQLITAHLLERAGLRRTACDAAFEAFGQSRDARAIRPWATMARSYVAYVPRAASWLPALCRDSEDVPPLIALLEHEDGWVRINAAKTLMFLEARVPEARETVTTLARLLAESKPEADYGYYGAFRFNEDVVDGGARDGQDEYDAPSPRWREAFVRAVGHMGGDEHAPLLTQLLEDDRNALGIQYAAALALNDLGTPRALDALKNAEVAHPYHSIRLVAREALWRCGIEPACQTDVPSNEREPPLAGENTALPKTMDGLVFIKGPNDMPNDFQIDKWRQTYTTTDSGPTYRLGWNLYRLDPCTPEGEVTQLTHFDEGYVADCEVSWDGERIVFAHRGEDDPWWHIYEMAVDGSRLVQLTHGPYHDVQPAYLPDGRIVFSSTRIGIRDEYHAYLSTGLTVMNPDGSDIHCIAFNTGRDNEPAVLDDGRIVFSRLELFYAYLKTELTVHAVHPDGTHDVTLYGPERRGFWGTITHLAGERWWGEVPTRHRLLRLTQPQPFDAQQVVCASSGGLVLCGPGRTHETIIPHRNDIAMTSPFPMPDGTVLCAITTKEFTRGSPANDARNINLGLYRVDAETGASTLLYDDPECAEFEPRPIMPRPCPPHLPESPAARGNAYTARFLCGSAHTSRDAPVRERGKLVRVIEGQPFGVRHCSHTARDENAWRNHTGTLARILGTVPLAADGSFHIEAPADRLLHLQVLDSDRRVVGNQLIWMYARPGETRACIGCHETVDSAAPANAPALAAAAKTPSVPCLPHGDEFAYRAKFWNKGLLTDAGEERLRTVQAVNLLGRH